MPNFWPFFSEWTKLTKLSQYLTVFPSHLNNIFLKSFRLLPNLMRNCKILQKLITFHETNNISQNSSGITLGFCEVAKHIVDFRFHFQYFWKMTPKFWFHWNRFKILKFQTWQSWKLKSQYCSYLMAYSVTKCLEVIILGRSA